MKFKIGNTVIHKEYPCLNGIIYGFVSRKSLGPNPHAEVVGTNGVKYLWDTRKIKKTTSFKQTDNIPILPWAIFTLVIVLSSPIFAFITFKAIQ